MWVTATLFRVTYPNQSNPGWRSRDGSCTKARLERRGFVEMRWERRGSTTVKKQRHVYAQPKKAMQVHAVSGGNKLTTQAADWGCKLGSENESQWKRKTSTAATTDVFVQNWTCDSMWLVARVMPLFWNVFRRSIFSVSRVFLSTPTASFASPSQILRNSLE